MAAFWVLLLAFGFSLQSASSQIPSVCADAESLQNMICCPGDCGTAYGRGSCVPVIPPPSTDTTDVRANWPHYYRRICSCLGNYAGVDCSRCKYGYHSENCDEKQVLPRLPAHHLSPEQWKEYINIIKMARTYSSGYKMVLSEALPGTSSIRMVDGSLYELFVWVHHYASKDADCGGKHDYIQGKGGSICETSVASLVTIEHTLIKPLSLLYKEVIMLLVQLILLSIGHTWDETPPKSLEM